jgi:glycosyltransferase involved in cell wall biosynthesis
MNRKISLAIPHYNNSNFIFDAILPALTDNKVSEIIICDDYSNDIDNLLILLNNINNNKIKLFINNENKGAYHNKIDTLSKCTNEWAILLDSDNIISSSYIDKLFEIPQWDKTVIYAPSNAVTFPGYPNPDLNFSIYEKIIITKNVYINEFENDIFRCLTNNCNYFLPVKTFLSCMKPVRYLYDRSKMEALDGVALFTDWIHNNNTFIIVEGLQYHHRIHPNSMYALSKTKIYGDEVREKLLEKILTIPNTRMYFFI